MKFISLDNEQYRDDDDSLINIKDGCIARNFLYFLTLHNLTQLDRIKISFYYTNITYNIPQKNLLTKRKYGVKQPVK